MSAIKLSIFLAFSVLYAVPEVSHLSPPNDFFRLHKIIPQQLRDSELREMRDSTRLFLIAGLRSLSWLEYYHRPVGRLDILYEAEGIQQASTVCSATLLDSGVIITAAHCIPGPPGLTAAKANMVMDYLADGQTEDYRFSVDPREIAVDYGYDVSLLKAPPALTSRYRGLSSRFRRHIPGETVFIIGHPLGQGKRLSTGECRVLSMTLTTDDFFEHSCATMAGSSGALTMGIDGAIIGVHVGVGGLDNKSAAIASLYAQNERFRPYFRPVPPPPKIDRRGYVIPDNEWHKALQREMRSPNVRNFIRQLGKEYGRYDTPVLKGLSLAHIAVEADSVPAMEEILAAGYRFNNHHGGQLLEAAVRLYEEGNTHSLEMVKLLLKAGAPIVLDSSGRPIPCSVKRAALIDLFRDYPC